MTYYRSVLIDGTDATGTREAWAGLLARLTIGFARGIPADGSPAWSRLPDADPDNRIPGMEGFCRMSVAWSAWLAGPGNADALDYGGHSVDVLDLVVRGLADGTDPSGPWYWGDIRDRDQRIVEAAELAFTLWTGRERILPALGPARRRQVLAWMSQVHGRDVYADNWVLFPAIVATVSRGLGEHVDDRHIDEGIDRMLAWYRGDGWYSDGEGHAFDRYTGWAIHWHLLHWADIDGDRRPDVRDLVVERARTWLRDLPALAAKDGRSRSWAAPWATDFATAGPLGLAAVLDELPIDPGMARGIIDRSIRYHLAHDAIDPATDWFRVGVWGRRPDVCERYMSAGASAWAVRALVPLSLPRRIRSGLRQTRGCRAARHDPSIPRSTSCSAARATWSVAGPSVAGRGSRRRSWTIRTTSPVTTTDRPTASGCSTATSRSPTTLPMADPDPTERCCWRAHVGESAIGSWWMMEAPEPTGSGRAIGSPSTAPVTPCRRYPSGSAMPGSGPSASAYGPVRAVTASLPLGVADPAVVTRHGDATRAIEAATDGTRWVAIRALTGYDRVLLSGRLAAALTAPGRRALGAAVGRRVGGIGRGAPARAHRRLSVPGAIHTRPRRHRHRGARRMRTLIVRPPSGEVCRLSVGAQPPERVELDGWTVTGPALHVVRLGPAGAWLAGESIGQVRHGDATVLSLDGPGPVEVRRLADGSVSWARPVG